MGLGTVGTPFERRTHVRLPDHRLSVLAVALSMATARNYGPERPLVENRGQRVRVT